MRRRGLAVQLRYDSNANDGASEIEGHKRYARCEYYGQRSFCEYPSVCNVQFYGKSRGRGSDGSSARSAYSYAMYARNYRTMGARKSDSSYRRTARA